METNDGVTVSRTQARLDISALVSGLQTWSGERYKRVFHAFGLQKAKTQSPENSKQADH